MKNNSLAHAAVKVIAHRGASGHLPEHTLPAKALAYGMGAHYLEQDVVLTKDNELVVLHDIHIDAITDVALHFPSRKRVDGRYYAIDFTLAEILTLNVHERVNLKKGEASFPNRFPFVGPISLTTGSKYFKSEIRATGYRIESENSLPIYIQCFDPASLQALASINRRKIPLIQLMGENSWNEAEADYEQMLTADGMKKVSSYAAGIGPWIPQVLGALNEKKQVKSSSFLQAAINIKLEIHPYTFRADALPSGYHTSDDLHKTLF